MIKAQFWKIPKEQIPEFKQAFSQGEYHWLISKWNELGIGKQLCPMCPESLSTIHEQFRKYFGPNLLGLYNFKTPATDKEIPIMFINYVAPSLKPENLSHMTLAYMRRSVLMFGYLELKAQGIRHKEICDILSLTLKYKKNSIKKYFPKNSNS